MPSEGVIRGIRHEAPRGRHPALQRRRPSSPPPEGGGGGGCGAAAAVGQGGQSGQGGGERDEERGGGGRDIIIRREHDPAAFCCHRVSGLVVRMAQRQKRLVVGRGILHTSQKLLLGPRFWSIYTKLASLGVL